MKAPDPQPAAPALELRDLRVTFTTDEGELPAVNGVSLVLKRGQVLGIVGESGCGKSVTAYAILRLIRPPGRVVGGQILLYPPDGGAALDLAGLNDRSELLYEVRGGRVGMIFQEPMVALSPVHTIGDQIAEVLLLHRGMNRGEAWEMTIRMLERVGIPGAAKRVGQYPHELSGGMRQRAVIAMGLVANPEVLIADEPTTALDVTIQAQILALIKTLQREMGTSVLFITHDLAVVAQMADEVAVMYLGRVVERGTVRAVLRDPLHPYTAALLRSLPSASGRGERLSAISGQVPPLAAVPSGCAFHPRCPYAKPGVCDVGAGPESREVVPGREVACLRVETIRETGGSR